MTTNPRNTIKSPIKNPKQNNDIQNIFIFLKKNRNIFNRLPTNLQELVKQHTMLKLKESSNGNKKLRELSKNEKIKVNRKRKQNNNQMSKYILNIKK